MEPDVPLPESGLLVVMPVMSEGARAVSRAEVLSPRATEPEVPLPVRGLEVVMPLMREG